MSSLFPFRRISWCFALAALGLITPSSLCAQDRVFQLNAAQSEVDFALDASLHTVHGKFRLKRGFLRFDPMTGIASGELVVDTESGDSASNARDRKMKHDVLETQKFPDIVFAPQRIIGTISASGGSQLQMQGMMTLHGQPHPMTLIVPLRVNGSEATALVHFEVPYEAWGLKNPSTLFLRVSNTVQIDVHAVGTLTSETAAASAAAKP